MLNILGLLLCYNSRVWSVTMGCFPVVGCGALFGGQKVSDPFRKYVFSRHSMFFSPFETTSVECAAPSGSNGVPLLF